MIVRKSLGTGISGAVRYVMGEGKRDPLTGEVPQLEQGETSRVAWYGGTGFGFPIDNDERLDTARRVMEWAAQTQSSKTKKCRQDCLHLTLAWDKDEDPSRAEMEAAAHSLLEQLGMSQARAIWACHDDTEHSHLHLIVSRIDPQSGKAFRDSFDTHAMSQWALQWEKDHGGVRCEARLGKDPANAERDPEARINALAARRETFTERDLNRELIKAIPSRETRRRYIAGVLERPDIIRLADPETGKVVRYTTRQTLAAEHLAEGAGDRLYSDASHRVSGRAMHEVLGGLQAQGRELREDQMRALVHATGAEGLAVITGKAGTGKSFTMKAIQDAYEADGYEVKSLAPTNKVASSLRRDGLDAGTIHSALGNLDKGRTEWTRQTVVMVDEAGMVSTRLLARVLSHAEEAGAKVILVGDDKQLASMDRGGMFGHFAHRHGAAELSQITRQRSADQRELAVRASHYDFAVALASLDQAGGVAMVERGSDRVARVAEIWRDRTAQAPARSLFVIAVSNADAEAANRAIRQIRRERGELGDDHQFSTRDGPRAFAEGDRILFSGSAYSRKDRAAGLANGNSAVVTKIAGDQLTVAIDGAKPGATVTFTVGKNREAGEFDAVRHGYAGTIYKAQGATYDEAIVLDSRGLKASAAYVALTRHREHVTVVTARELNPRFDSWVAGAAGFGGLTPEQQERAREAYENWRADGNPKAAKKHDLAAYVAYVQEREGERRSQAEETAAMAKRWQRADDRRAASRFEALNYRPADAVKLTPAEVRAVVGVETFEDGAGLPGPIAQTRTTAGLAAMNRKIVAAEEQRLDALYGPPDKNEAPAGSDEASDAAGSAGGSDPWAWQMPPRPESVEEERAMIASFARPVIGQLRQPAARERDTVAGLRWWERVAVEGAEMIRIGRDWARGKWQALVEGGHVRDDHKGPENER